jgi:hypothetical protein
LGFNQRNVLGLLRHVVLRLNVYEQEMPKFTTSQTYGDCISDFNEHWACAGIKAASAVLNSSSIASGHLGQV